MDLTSAHIQDGFQKTMSKNEEDEDINELIDSITELWERHNNICWNIYICNIYFPCCVKY